jgi:hypothetical protein
MFVTIYVQYRIRLPWHILGEKSLSICLRVVACTNLCFGRNLVKKKMKDRTSQWTNRLACDVSHTHFIGRLTCCRRKTFCQFASCSTRIDSGHMVHGPFSRILTVLPSLFRRYLFFLLLLTFSEHTIYLVLCENFMLPF